jgi:hypothetical protein
LGYGVGGRESRQRPAIFGAELPGCLANLRVLDEHETAANEAALAGDRDAYLEALRAYCRAGRDEALRIRQGAA